MSTHFYVIIFIVQKHKITNNGLKKISIYESVILTDMNLIFNILNKS